MRNAFKNHCRYNVHDVKINGTSIILDTWRTLEVTSGRMNKGSPYFFHPKMDSRKQLGHLPRLKFSQPLDVIHRSSQQLRTSTNLDTKPWFSGEMLSTNLWPNEGYVCIMIQIRTKNLLKKTDIHSFAHVCRDMCVECPEFLAENDIHDSKHKKNPIS